MRLALPHNVLLTLSQQVLEYAFPGRFMVVDVER
jgi:hypothetical protein